MGHMVDFAIHLRILVLVGLAGGSAWAHPDKIWVGRTNKPALAETRYRSCKAYSELMRSSTLSKLWLKSK